MRLSVLSIVALAAATPSLASAQVSSTKSTVLSIQPIDAMLTVYAGEAEIAMSRSVTLGAGATYWGPQISDGDFRYLSGDLKVRYYPDAKPFQGFSFGGSVGVTHIKGTDNTSQSSGSASGPSIGVMLDYNWLVGAQKAFYVGLGAGAKRVFISDKNVSDQATVIYPTLRISVGWAL